MSKFFKALENAERERRVAPTAESVRQEREKPKTHASVAPEPSRVETVVVDAPRAAETAVVEPPRRETTVVVESPPTEREEPGEPASPVYGAPVTRRTGESPFLEPEFVFDARLPPEPGELDDRLVSLLHPTSFAAEQYRSVRLAIETFRRERGTHVLAVSSPGRAEGKTVTAINLAGALAQAPDARVVLIEADLRHPRIAEYLGLPPGPGLSAYLLDPGMPVERVLTRPPGIAFDALAAGAPSSMPYELLKSPRLTALLALLRERYDFVLLDTPAVFPFPDVGILGEVVDGFVLVVRANRTPRETLRDGLRAVGRERTLGVIFNDDDRPMTTGTVEATWRDYLGGSRSARSA